MPDRDMIEFGNSDNNLQVIKNGDEYTFSVNDEWCGNTESGFGATVSIVISKDSVKDLIKFLKQP